MLKFLNIICTTFYQIRNRILGLTGTMLFRIDLQAAGFASIGKEFHSNGIAFLRLKKGSRIIIGDGFKLNNGEIFNSIGRQTRCVISVRENAELIIGNNVGMSSSTIFCNRKITIGNNVKIGGNTCIYDTDFHSLDFMSRRIKQEDIKKTVSNAVHIGNDVFIGAHSTILKGVSIGDRAIIGACSVITRNIPAGEIWAGNPAKCIRTSFLQPALKYS